MAGFDATELIKRIREVGERIGYKPTRVDRMTHSRGCYFETGYKHGEVRVRTSSGDSYNINSGATGEISMDLEIVRTLLVRQIPGGN